VGVNSFFAQMKDGDMGIWGFFYWREEINRDKVVKNGMKFR
jgi:hypothetical protein